MMPTPRCSICPSKSGTSGNRDRSIGFPHTDVPPPGESWIVDNHTICFYRVNVDVRPVVTVQHGESVPAQLDSISAAAELRMVPSSRLAEAIGGADVLFLYDFSSGALESVWPEADALRWRSEERRGGKERADGGAAARGARSESQKRRD